MDSEETFKTNDIGLAAYLEMLGHKHLETQWVGKSCWWIFVEVPGVTTATDRWIDRSVQVEPRSYNEHYKRLKYPLMSVLRGTGDRVGTQQG